LRIRLPTFWRNTLPPSSGLKFLLSVTDSWLGTRRWTKFKLKRQGSNLEPTKVHGGGVLGRK
jgi:hypothetical protein